MPPVGFEPTISAGERPQTYALDRAATGTGNWKKTTVGRTSLDELSARLRDLYLTTHNNHNRQTSMPPVGFEPTISAGERPQTYALDRAATGTGNWKRITHKNNQILSPNLY